MQGAGVLCCQSRSAWEQGGRRKIGEGGRKRKEKKEKGKGKKRKRKWEKEKWRERERERAVGGVHGGGLPRARCGVRPVSDEPTEREKGKWEH